MKRSGFKPRKTSMRQAWAEKMRATHKPLWATRAKPKDRTRYPKAPKPRRPLKKQSTARAREMRLYYQEAKVWLNQPEHARCAICLLLDQTPMASTEVHHLRGRIGRLLRDQRFWVPSCRPCREIPHERPTWAREMGILAQPADWNVYPS